MSKKVVVLDDDPTGTQTVHGIPVLTTWRAKTLEQELLTDLPAFYVLTNTRAMSPEAARSLTLELARNLREASERVSKPFVVVSRSDSTLRGHFPLELEALEQALETRFDAWLLIPFFEAGGRITKNDVHYLREGTKLTPVAETEFANDATFGFKSSNLREWVEEKTAGRVRAQEVQSISLSDIQAGKVTKRLLELPKGCICIVNAEARHDMTLFVDGLLGAERQGKRYLYRTAASFAAARAGIRPRPFLTAKDLELPTTGGGLTVVGSYIQKSSEQLNKLLELPVNALEVKVEHLLTHERASEIARVAGQAEALLKQNKDVVIYTSRQLLRDEAPERSLEIGERVSRGLVDIVRGIAVRPRYVLAKGGITSSDIATRGLEIKRAMVLGQVAAGVPVWRAGPESRFPGLTYIIFPGNVGKPETLAEVVQTLSVKA
jgi:uncharacterized protein YgbK (DUF1537 family)